MRQPSPGRKQIVSILRKFSLGKKMTVQKEV